MTTNTYKPNRVLYLGPWFFILAVLVTSGAAMSKDIITDQQWLSDSGQLSLRVVAGEEIVTGEYLTWQVTATDSRNKLAGAVMKVSGGMRAHGHGLPTRPEITRIDKGSFEVAGLFFNMPGDWFLRFEIRLPDQSVEQVLLEFHLKP